jgi:hypothetical protein
MAIAGPDAIASHFLSSLNNSERGKTPYPHWLLSDMLPADICAGIDALPVAAPAIGDTKGRRETHNSTRLFFGVSQRAEYPVCDALAQALQKDETVAALEAECNVALAGASLRIEYCLDTDGFWLEPHTDIGAKLFTMLVYLSDDPGSGLWGTDILDGPDRLVATTPYRRDCGLIFVPGENTWHGWHKRPIATVRRSLIVNYVRPEWRSRHELAFPEMPVLS